MIKTGKGMLWVSTFLLVLGSAEASQAMGRKQEPSADLTLGEIALGGTGCKQGGGVVEVSKDSREVRIRFDQMAVIAGGENGVALDRKNCAVSIPVVSLPENHRVIITEVQLGGSHDVAGGALGHVSHETFLAGATGEKFEQDLGGTEQGSAGEIRIARPAAVSTGCDESATLRANTSLFVRESGSANPRVSEVKIGELQLKLKVVSCR